MLAGVVIHLQCLLDGCLEALASCFTRWTKPLVTSLPLATLTDLGKSKSQLIAENALWRRQYVEILPLVQAQQEAKPPPRPPRALRSHHRWRGPDRLACNAWWGPPHLRVSVAGAPACLATK